MTVHHAAGELHAIDEVAARQLPGAAGVEPEIGTLDLPAVPDLLREQAAPVTDAVTAGRQPEIGHAVEQARGQAAESAIAQRRLDLELGELVEIDAMLRQRPPARVMEAQIHEGVEKNAAGQKLHRE